VLIVHPDKTPLEDAKAAFVRVNEAFMCLSNDRARADYDAAGAGDPEAFREEHEAQTATMRETVLANLAMLENLGIRLPPEEVRGDFGVFIEELAHSGRLKEAFESWSRRAGVGMIVIAGVAVQAASISIGVFACLVALGPFVIGPAIAWEEILASFENKTLLEQLGSYKFLEVTSSAISSSVRLSVVWSMVLVAAAVTVPIQVTQYTASRLYRANVEQLEAWEVTDVDNDGEPVFHAIKTHDPDAGQTEQRTNGDVVFTDSSTDAPSAAGSLMNGVAPYSRLDPSEEDAQMWTLVDVVPTQSH